MLTESSFKEKGKIIAKTVGKYASTSVLATLVDFSIFHYAVSDGVISAVQSTIIGRLAGASVAFSLHRIWVFKTIDTPQYKTLFFKYLLGIIIGLAFNVVGVWFLNDILNIDAWSSRLITAAAVWFLIFSYNKHVVFKEKIIADQDFAEIDEDDTEGSLYEPSV